MNSITVKKADGTAEPFDKQKLLDSLRNAGGTDGMVAKIASHIEDELKDGSTTNEIYQHAFKLLRDRSAPIAIKYSLRRALGEFGPEGFPFEKYIARIFNEWGYETLTDQTVFGGCVAHEVDVIAWNKESLNMTEVKFHNEFGLKSDLKVILYVKARFDDLKENFFEYGGIKRKLTQGWLITNTKFTDQAIKYGECQKIKMIGWNYPKHGNLQDIVEELRLHPLTCLSSLSSVHKRLLLTKGYVLCRDLVDKPQAMDDIGMAKEEKEKALNEAKEACGVK